MLRNQRGVVFEAATGITLLLLSLFFGALTLDSTGKDYPRLSRAGERIQSVLPRGDLSSSPVTYVNYNCTSLTKGYECRK